MADISREELARLYQTLDDGFRGVHARLDKLNGTVGDHGEAIAVLEDRGTRDPLARVGGGIVAVILLIWAWLK